ncbi:hypothetical protein DFH09DRAFT_1276395 [Mycena vulgaris]|nr:hypothetical protein DFH09DRAFT_1276395 [Mycena vulgaris]
MSLSHFLPFMHAPNVDEVHSDSAIYSLANAEALSTLPALQKLHLQFVFFTAKQAAGDMPEGAFRALEENANLERLRLKFKKTADEGVWSGWPSGGGDWRSISRRRFRPELERNFGRFLTAEGRYLGSLVVEDLAESERGGTE